MKLFGKYFFVALMSIFALASCSDDDKYVAGEQESAGKAGVYFPVVNGGDHEVDPSDPTEFTVSIARLDSTEAISVPLTVVENDNNAYQVSTAEFKAGEGHTTVKVSFPDAEVGTTNTLTIEVPKEYIALYKNNAERVSYTTSYTRVRWEDAGVGYWVDGNINSLFGVEALPLVVELEKTVSVDGTTTRYRFDSPFAYTATGQDELGGYIGYPYNDTGDCDEQSHKMIVTVKNNQATLASTNTGMTWADYGTFYIGQIVGNLSNSNGVITDTETYPLGTLKVGKDKTPGVITWPANSLYIRLTEFQGGYIGVASNPSYLYLSADDFKAYLDSQTDE